jgi:MFS transporter, DHA2 family, multidrug resistance protein
MIVSANTFEKVTINSRWFGWPLPRRSDANGSGAVKSPASQKPTASDAQRGTHGWLVAALILATAAEAFVLGGVGVALPNMAASFGASADEISWAVTLYLVGFTVMLPLTAWFSDVLGQRLFLAASMVVYMVASVGCAASHSLTLFLVMRTLQGAAGAPYLVRALLTFGTQLTPAAFRRASFIIAIPYGFKTIAPIVSGYLADHYSWRYFFLIPIPLLGLAALLPLIMSTEVWPRRRHPHPDVAGLALLIAGLGGLFIALYRGQQDAWFDSAMIRGMIVVAVIAIPLLIWHSHRPENHRRFIAPESLRHRGVIAGLFYGFFIGILLYAGVYLLPQFLRVVGRHDAFGAGLLTSVDFLATTVGLVICTLCMGLVRTRAWLFLSGVLFTASMILFATRQTSATADDALYLPLILRGLSIGFLLPSSAMLTFQAVLSANHGHAAEARGLFHTTRQLGGAIGVAVIVAMLDARGTLHSGQLSEHLNSVSPAYHRVLATLTTGLAHHGLAPSVSERAAQVAMEAMVRREATVLSFQDVFFVMAGIGAVASVLAFAFESPRKRARQKATAENEKSSANSCPAVEVTGLVSASSD